MKNNEENKNRPCLNRNNVVVMAAVGVTYAQYVNAQNQNRYVGQAPQGYMGSYGFLPPNNGHYPQNPQQGAYPPRMGMGMGMMGGHYW